MVRRDRRRRQSRRHHRDRHGQRALALRGVAALRLHGEPALPVGHDGGSPGITRRTSMVRTRTATTSRVISTTPGAGSPYFWWGGSGKNACARDGEVSEPVNSVSGDGDDVIPSPVDPNVECVRVRSVGAGDPPVTPPAGGQEPPAGGLCPPGYVPRRRRRHYASEGKRVITGEPPTRNPEPPTRT